MKKLAPLCAAIAVLSLVSARAGTIGISGPLTTDASSGISTSNTYTHTISGGGAESVNGVAFALLDSGNTPANFSWVVSSVKNQINDNNGGWSVVGSGVSHPGLLGLLGSFTFNNNGAPGSNQTFTLTSLTPGTTYETRLYMRKWDDSTARGQLASFTAGGAPTDTITFYEDHPEVSPILQPSRESAWYLSYTYTADASGSLAIRFDVQESGNVQGDPGSFHMYGLTNQVIPEPSAMALLGIGMLGLVRRRRR
jgi:PEP-CTERM motif